MAGTENIVLGRQGLGKICRAGGQRFDIQKTLFIVLLCKKRELKTV